MEMKAAVKEKWIAALEGGEYEQTTSTLRSDFGGSSKWCCLGVLCDLAVKDGVGVQVKELRLSKWFCYDGDASYPPRSVREWAGLPIDSVSDASGEQQDALAFIARWNDTHGLNFHQIAEKLRAEVVGV